LTTLSVPVADDAPRREPAPGDLELIRQFVNTFDVESADEELSSPEGLHTWLADRGLVSAGQRLTAADVAITHELREALREVLEGNAGHTVPTAALRTVDRIAGGIPLHVRLQGGPRLDSDQQAGVAPAIGHLLAVIYASMTLGTWQRLKVCRNDECRWAYYDHSRNRSGAWCTMAICGNRMKGRTFRQRRVGSPAG